MISYGGKAYYSAMWDAGRFFLLPGLNRKTGRLAYLIKTIPAGSFRKFHARAQELSSQ